MRVQSGVRVYQFTQFKPAAFSHLHPILYTHPVVILVIVHLVHERRLEDNNSVHKLSVRVVGFVLVARCFNAFFLALSSPYHSSKGFTMYTLLFTRYRKFLLVKFDSTTLKLVCFMLICFLT